jgi:uncharacterized protein YaeQ
MALPPTIYRVNLQLADVDRGCYQQLAVTVARHPSETTQRLLARLLAYALCFEEGLNFSRGISAGNEPDLWLKGPDGRVELWIEVGLPDSERIVKATRHARRVILLAFGKGLPRWRDQHLPRLLAVRNLQVLTLDAAFLKELEEGLERSIAWEMTTSDGTLYLNSAGKVLETVLHQPVGERSPG